MPFLPSFITLPPFHELKADMVMGPLEPPGQRQDTLVMAEQLIRKSLSPQNHGTVVQILACKAGL